MSLATTARHTLVVVVVVVLAIFLVLIRHALLLAFLAIVIATLLEAIAAPLRRATGASRRVALLGVCIGVVGLVSGIVWLAGARVQTQISELLTRLPEAAEQAEQRLGISVEGLIGENSPLGSWLTSSALPEIASMGWIFMTALTTVILAAAAGIFVAAQPDVYRSGLVRLFPSRQRERVSDALDQSGDALRRWLVAQGIAMVAVGLLAGFGSWLLGLPSPIAIGLLAGLVEFIPLVGPVIGALPALLIALSESGTLLLWTAVLFLAIQQIEGNLITPIASQRAAEVPPAFFLIAAVCGGLLFGFFGVVIAAPLSVVTLCLVRSLYVEDTLENGNGE